MIYYYNLYNCNSVVCIRHRKKREHRMAAYNWKVENWFNVAIRVYSTKCQFSIHFACFSRPTKIIQITYKLFNDDIVF